MALSTIKHDVMGLGRLYQVQEVLIMLLRIMAKYTYIIMNGNNAGQAVCCLVHLHLKDILGHLQTKWHIWEPIPSMMGIKGGQVMMSPHLGGCSRSHL